MGGDVANGLVSGYPHSPIQIEPLRRPITMRHLLSHSSGLSYGLLDPGAPMYRACAERKVLGDGSTLAELVDTLATLPLAYQPGESWEYSIATDALGHLIETITGARPGDAFRARILEPLGMRDTGFVVPEADRDRMAALYVGDPLDPTKPGLRRLDDTPYPGAYTKPMPRQSGGGGLVSSLDDQVALVRALLPDGPTRSRHPARRARCSGAAWPTPTGGSRRARGWPRC